MIVSAKIRLNEHNTKKKIVFLLLSGESIFGEAQSKKKQEEVKCLPYFFLFSC